MRFNVILKRMLFMLIYEQDSNMTLLEDFNERISPAQRFSKEAD